MKRDIVRRAHLFLRMCLLGGSQVLRLQYQFAFRHQAQIFQIAYILKCDYFPAHCRINA